MIQKWLEKGCDYTEGVTIYGFQKNHSKNLMRLFLRGESHKNAEKLKYELGKRQNYKSQEPTVKIQEPIVKKIDKKKESQKPTTYFYRLNEIHIDLHHLLIKQRNDFQTAISLKLKLNLLPPFQEALALALCIEIENLFDAINTSQKVLDYYVHNKIILNTDTRNFTDLTPAQLLQRRNNKRVSISKYKNIVLNLKKELNTDLNKSEKTKTEVALERANKKLLLHQMELQELDKMINGK